jgi:hypothetical protein
LAVALNGGVDPADVGLLGADPATRLLGDYREAGREAAPSGEADSQKPSRARSHLDSRFKPA